MQIVDGRPQTQSVEEILDAMMENAKENFGDDLNESQTAAIRSFYSPTATMFAELQESAGIILDSAQLDHAEGKALTFLTALIGVGRKRSTRATTEATFSRETASDSVNYTVPRGTVIQTSGFDNIRFETTEWSAIEIGETEVTIPVRAVEAGTASNVGPNTLIVMPDTPSGIENVTNPEGADGGTEEESDDELRERAKSELSENARSTAPALISSISNLDSTKNVTIFLGTEHNLGDRPGFELVVEGGEDEEIANVIMENKAAGDKSYAGHFGEAIEEPIDVLLDNGQTFPIEFSRPIQIYIYLDVELVVTDEFEGNEAVMDSIVNYIGGVNSNSNNISGDLKTTEDVIYGTIEYAIRDVNGVYDVTSLKIGTTENPVSTSNIAIEDMEIATTKATSEYMSIQTTNL